MLVTALAGPATGVVLRGDSGWGLGWYAAGLISGTPGSGSWVGSCTPTGQGGAGVVSLGSLGRCNAALGSERSWSWEAVLGARPCSVGTLEVADQTPAGLVQGSGDDGWVHGHAEAEAHPDGVVA